MFRLLRFALISAAVIAVMILPGFISSAYQGSFTSIIVELQDDPAALYAAKARQNGATVTDAQVQAYRNQLRARQDEFLAALSGRGVPAQLVANNVADSAGAPHRVEFRYTLVFNGLTLKVPLGAVPAIKNMGEVKKVHQNKLLKQMLNNSVSYIRAPQVYGANRETTAFDEVHRDGFEGQGMKIAILDTGIEWSQEMFGGDPTPPRQGLSPVVAALNTNKKVVYSMPIVEGDAGEDDFGHGTHGAADAAGYRGFGPGLDGVPLTADDVPLHGVAPQARLMNCKVCYGHGSAISLTTGVGIPFIGGCPTSAIVAGIEDAVSSRTLTGFPKPIADVINLSLGGSGGPDDVTAVAADNAVLTGAIVVAAAGNSGPVEGSLGSPAAGRRVIGVGATLDPGSGPNTVDVVGQGRAGMYAFPFAGSAAITDITNNYVFCGLGETPDAVPDSVRGKIALIARGSTVDAGAAGTGLFLTKVTNAAAKGAIAAIIFNNVDGELTAATVYRTTIPALGMSKDNGEYLKSLIGSTAFGAVSAKQIRINSATTFVPAMADFSSRGPVLGLGQVKPDVSAPGVDILSATTPTGPPVASMADPTRYIAASGTSFASPHVSGAVALLKQAHLNWADPQAPGRLADMIRTALINTSTNMRTNAGTPIPDGTGADSIIAQGGGLIDVSAAANVKALMGVVGDGVNSPFILGSHSYREVPVVNSRVTHTESVTVTIQDVSGQGGAYSLQVANNRDLQLNGITVTASPSSVTVPPGGAATFTVNATVDGNVIRDVMAAKTVGNQVIFEPIQMQWYVVANRAGGSETLRMPFYLKPTPSLPAGIAATETEPHNGTVVVGDQSIGLAPGVTHVDIPVNVTAATLRVDATLDFPAIVEGNVPDLDFFAYDPDGVEVARSTNAGGPEALSFRPTRTGTHTVRVSGWANGPTDYDVLVTKLLGGAAPTLQTIPGDYADGQGRKIDFDGTLTLQWQPNGAQGYEVEQSTDNQSWQVIANVGGNQSSLALNNLANGEYFFRVRSLTPGQIGFFVTAPGNVQSVVVDQRVHETITNAVRTAMSNVSLVGGVFQLDLSLTNQSATLYVPRIEFKVIRINSASGSVAAINADNGGNGTSESNAALFDYSRKVGAEEEFAPNEVSGTRTLRFQDNASELFTFDAVVTAYRRVASGGPGASNPASGGASAAGSSSPLPSVTSLLRFTANPLTRTVTVQRVALP